MFTSSVRQQTVPQVFVDARSAPMRVAPPVSLWTQLMLAEAGYQGYNALPS